MVRGVAGGQPCREGFGVLVSVWREPRGQNPTLRCPELSTSRQPAEVTVPLHSALGAHPGCCVQVWAPHIKKDGCVCDCPWTCPEKAAELVTGLAGMSWGEELRTLCPSRLERSLGVTSLLSAASQGGKVAREVLSPSPGDPLVGCVGMVQICVRGGLDWPLKSIYLLQGWSNSL